jgi:hypothetical protein
MWILDCGRYLKGWFTIDFVSCLPLSYIAYFSVRGQR